MDIAYLLRRSVLEHPERTALQCRDETRTYAQLDERAQRLANGLRRLGLQPGEHVGVLLENRIEYPEVDVALAYAGLVRVALNVRLPLDDLSYILDDAEVRGLVTEAKFDVSASELVQRHDVRWVRIGGQAPTDTSESYERLIESSSARRDHVADQSLNPAWISYTSGTTGRPKGVVLGHEAMTQVAFNTLLEFGPINDASSIVLPQPLSHGAGYFVLPYLASGGRVHIVPKFDPEQIVAEGRKHRVQTLKLVPTMLVDLLDAGVELPFETVIYGASPIDRSRLGEALDRFGPIFVQIYGQSEAPMTITRLTKRDHAVPGDHLSSAGRPWRTVELDVVDDEGATLSSGELGEVRVKGRHVMTGYYRRPDLTSEVLKDGYIWTRDMGYQDERGYVYLRGRRDDMINSGGFNIAPKEVEMVAGTHPAVAECVAVGVPDDRWGQAVRLYVALRPDHELEPSELIEYSRGALGFRRPRSVVVVETVPKTSYGKIDRSALESMTPISSSDGEAPR